MIKHQIAQQSKKIFKLPHNVLLAYQKKYKCRMNGAVKAINAIQHGIQQFQQFRKESRQLKRVYIYSYKENELCNQQFYVIKIKGRQNTYYQKRNIYFYMFFEDGYPETPPEIMVAELKCSANHDKFTPFLHLNMDENGHVCMHSNQLNQQYYQHTTLKDMIIQLQKMIYSPSVGSSYSSELFNSYNNQGDNTQYYKLLNNQAKKLQLCEDEELNDEDQESQQDS